MKTLCGWVVACVVCCAAIGAEMRVAGEAFIVAGTGKFRAADVVAYPLEAALSALNTMSSHPDMPAPLAKTQTDSEGRWALTVPKETPFLLIANGIHYASRAKRATHFEWRIKSTDIEDFGNVMLTERNGRPVGHHVIRRR